MLYREIIAVCSNIHTKHINTLCGKTMELVNVKPVVHTVTTGLQIPNMLGYWIYLQYSTVHSSNHSTLLILYETTISPYRAVNTLRLGYKNQSVNAV
jgi:hypothetical protein